MKKLIFIMLFSAIGISFLVAQTVQEIRPLTPTELETACVVPAPPGNENAKVMAPCGGNAANDNFANAQALVVNGGIISGSVCGTLEAGEKFGCVNTPNMSIWYKFVATATTHYVQATLTSGSCYFGLVIYGNLTGVPTTTCGGAGSQYPISCQSGAGGPPTQLHMLTNLTIGATYHIQLTQSTAAACLPNQSIVNIQVTTNNPGGTITNRPPLNSCATAGAGCYFSSPPAVAAVTSGCPSYQLSAAGYTGNGVWQATFQYTNSATASNVSLQAIISSNCAAGNVSWFNWRLYDCSCTLIACGTLANLTVQGLACGTCYRFEYIMELANCSSFTTIWPYQNIPATPIPCTVLPLNLLFFNAIPDKGNNSVGLEWKTVSEKDIRSFRLERSENGIDYKTIANGIDAVGSGYKYTFTDRTITENQMYYYKLIAVDNAGKDDYERVIVLAAQTKHKDINLVPNPASNAVDIVLDETKTYTSIEIYNTLGQKVKSVTPELNATKFSIDLSDLSKGIYFVDVLTSDDEMISKKLIKE